MNNVAKRYLIIAAIVLGSFLLVIIAIKGIQSGIANHAFEIGMKKNEATISALQMQVKARDLIIQADSAAISGHIACVDSLTKENTRLRAFISVSQKNTSNEISTYRALPPNERLRKFAKLVH